MRQGYGHMVLDHTVEKVKAMRAERRRRLAAVTTREEALAYRDEVRTKIAAVFTPFPDKTPLNAHVGRHVERPGYHIDNVVFESRPGCLVTGNLYIPDDLDGPAPCVLGACGHTITGKAADYNQNFAQRLVASGFVVFVFDPLNQGERIQYVDIPGAQETAESSVKAHNMMGKQLELLGDNMPNWFAWDAIRALDYLLSRPEVDSTRVGMTGCSGGGTQTTWMCGLDDRLTMAAPSCFVITFLSNLENELPADAEQYPVGALGAGLEQADFIIARAPKPVIFLGQRYDFFDRRGLAEAHSDVRRIYDLLGADQDDLVCYYGDYPHGYKRSDQEEMVAFFARHAGIDDVRLVPETEPLGPDPLYATPTGNVIEAGGTPVYALAAQRADELAKTRPSLAPDALRERLASLLKVPTQRGVPHYRNLRPDRGPDVTFGRVAVEVEGNVRALMMKRMAHPERAHALTVDAMVNVYVAHLSSEEDLVSDPLALDLQKRGDLYAIDVRGLGVSAPDDGLDFLHPYGVDYMMHGHGLMFNEPYVGRRVLDVLTTIDLLCGMGAKDVRLYGRGQGAILALFAAVLDDRVTAVTYKNGPESFQEWISAPIVHWPAANVLPGVLHHFDVSDLVACLGERVTVVEPWGPWMAPVDG